jgi:hypothetical protein
MAAEDLALGGVRRELFREDPDRYAGGAVYAAWPVRNRLRTAKANAPKRLVQFARISAVQFGKDLPLNLARQIGAWRRVRYKELGEAKWCAHFNPAFP